MKGLVNFLNQDNIQEGLKLGSSKIALYNEHPKDKKELKAILEERIDENPNADLNDIDVSKITDMKNLFYRMNIGKISIDKWDVSKVTDFSCMFMGCHNFEADLSKWNVSSGRNFTYMFYQCDKFDSDLSNWDIDENAQHRSMLVGCGRMTPEKLPKSIIK